MDTHEIERHLNRTSPSIERRGNVFHCTVCGASSRTLHGMQHNDDCVLGKAIADAAKAWQPVYAGESDVRTDTMLEIMGRLNPSDMERIEGLVDRFAEAETPEARSVVAEDMRRMCPGIDDAMLESSVLSGIVSQQHLQALKDSLLFEKAFGDEERMLLSQASEYLNAGDNYGRIMDAVKRLRITDSIR